MDKKTLRALALAGAVTGAGLAAPAGDAAAAGPHLRWICREELPGHRAFDLERCAYDQYPLAAPGAVGPNIGPTPGPGPGPTPYSS